MVSYKSRQKHLQSFKTICITLWEEISRTPDRDFRCLYLCEKKRTVAGWLHADRTSIPDVIVMFKLRHHVASQRIQDFLEVFCMFSNIK